MRRRLRAPALRSSPSTTSPASSSRCGSRSRTARRRHLAGAAEALAKLEARADPYDVVLCDLLDARDDGVTFYERMEALGLADRSSS